jgi:hypothetical protein
MASKSLKWHGMEEFLKRAALGELTSSAPHPLDSGPRPSQSKSSPTVPENHGLESQSLTRDAGNADAQGCTDSDERAPVVHPVIPTVAASGLHTTGAGDQIVVDKNMEPGKSCRVLKSRP